MKIICPRFSPLHQFITYSRNSIIRARWDLGTSPETANPHPAASESILSIENLYDHL